MPMGNITGAEFPQRCRFQVRRLLRDIPQEDKFCKDYPKWHRIPEFPGVTNSQHESNVFLSLIFSIYAIF
jgi:hypothetical protein